MHVAWSGNTVLRIERDSSTGTTIGGGELLLPGEVVVGPGDFYTTPWVFFATGEHGLDDVGPPGTNGSALCPPIRPSSR